LASTSSKCEFTTV